MEQLEVSEATAGSQLEQRSKGHKVERFKGRRQVKKLKTMWFPVTQRQRIGKDVRNSFEEFVVFHWASRMSRAGSQH